MKEIKLTKGYFALVDDEDFEYLNQYKWYAKISHRTCYAARSAWIDGKKKNLKMHRVIMQVHDREIEVDHIDRNGLNNTRENLRLCSHLENQRNTGLQSNNTSGHKGVSWHKHTKKWRAFIKLRGETHCLGYFHDIEDAIKAREKAAEELHGEFRS